MASLALVLLSLVSVHLIQVSYAASSDYSTKTLSSSYSAPSFSYTTPPSTYKAPSVTVTGISSASSKGPVSVSPGFQPETPQSANYTVIDIWVQPEQDRVNGGLCNSTRPPYNRTVAYTVTANGNAVIDGDIIFGTEADLLNAAVHPSLRKRAFSLTSASARRWPGGKVLYKYEPGLDADHINYFQEGVKVWTDRLPFLKFEYSNGPTARTVRASSGNSSPIGCCGGDIELCPSCNPRSARHEIGHTLGLLHEHQRPDRDSYLTLTCPGGTCSATVINNVAKLPGSGLNWAGSYDLASLMHYPLSGYIGNDPFTFVPQPGVIFTSAAQLPSPLDVRRVCELYWEDCHSICGDGILSPGYGEECDDGNNLSGDECSSSCKKEPPVCVPQCNPLPPNNVCGFRSQCTLFNPVPTFPHSGDTFCMCQAGYRGSGLDLSGKYQYRVSWANAFGGQTHRVFVKPGQDCGQLCDGIQCSEVPLKDSCR